jgi:hypothetical protein
LMSRLISVFTVLQRNWHIQTGWNDGYEFHNCKLSIP